MESVFKKPELGATGKRSRSLGGSSQTQLMGTERPAGVPMLRGLASKCYGPQTFPGWSSGCRLSPTNVMPSLETRNASASQRRQPPAPARHDVKDRSRPSALCGEVASLVTAGQRLLVFRTAASKARPAPLPCPPPLMLPRRRPTARAPHFCIKRFSGETPRAVPGPCTGMLNNNER